MKLIFTFLFAALLFASCQKEEVCDGGTLRISNTGDVPVSVFMDENVTILPGKYHDFHIDFQYTVSYRFDGSEEIQSVVVQVEPCTMLKIGLTD